VQKESFGDNMSGTPPYNQTRNKHTRRLSCFSAAFDGGGFASTKFMFKFEAADKYGVGPGTENRGRNYLFVAQAVGPGPARRLSLSGKLRFQVTRSLSHGPRESDAVGFQRDSKFGGEQKVRRLGSECRTHKQIIVMSNLTFKLFLRQVVVCAFKHNLKCR
jgi:hypothetical protein